MNDETYRSFCRTYNACITRRDRIRCLLQYSLLRQHDVNAGRYVILCERADNADWQRWPAFGYYGVYSSREEAQELGLKALIRTGGVLMRLE